MKARMEKIATKLAEVEVLLNEAEVDYRQMEEFENKMLAENINYKIRVALANVLFLKERA